MTVKLHKAEAAARKRDPQKYKWYKLAKGKAHFDSAHKDFDLELKRGEKFGLKFYRGSYFLVDEDDLSVQFKLSAEEGKKLIGASKPWAGKVANKPVQAGEPAQAVHVPNKREPAVKRKPRVAKPAKNGRAVTSNPSRPSTADSLVKELSEMKKLGMMTPAKYNKAVKRIKDDPAEVQEFEDGGMSISEMADLILNLV